MKLLIQLVSTMTFLDIVDSLLQSSKAIPKRRPDGTFESLDEVVRYVLEAARSSVVGLTSTLLLDHPSLGFEVDTDSLYDPEDDEIITDVSVKVLGNLNQDSALFFLTYGFTFYPESGAYSLTMLHPLEDLPEIK